MNLTPYNVLETFRNEIQAEHTLISHRITWFVTSQSFLMGAYVLSLSGTHKGEVLFRHAVPWLSVVLSILSGLSVGCAIDAQWNVIKLQLRVLNRVKEKNDCDHDDDSNLLNYYSSITYGSRKGQYDTHWLAMIPPFITPIVFALLWVVSYLWSLVKAPSVMCLAWGSWGTLLVLVMGFVCIVGLVGRRWREDVRLLKQKA